MRLLPLCLFTSALLAAAPTTSSGTWAGSWKSPQDQSLRITIERNGDSVHVKEERAGKVLSDYTCGLNAKDCAFKDEGHKATVSLWENGSHLVEVRTEGEAVTKRRFTPADNPNALQVEVMPMAQPSKPASTIVFARAN